MNGQWFGRYSATNSAGTISVNIDDMGDYYGGVAYLTADADPSVPSIPGVPQVPPIIALLRTKDKSKSFKLTLTTNDIGSFDPRRVQEGTWANVKQHYPYVTAFPQNADIRGRWSEKRLAVKWKTDIGTIGSAVLPKSEAHTPSRLTPIVKDWSDFKTYASTLEKRRFLFRGQDVLARLRTRFHRTKRADLRRFSREDVQILHRHLSGHTRHIYNLQDGDQNGSFYNLIQHHGYPTPLLDWTYSPYVAAFFAYRSVTNERAENKGAGDEKVRVYVFDQKLWRQRFPVQLPWPHYPYPHFSILEFMAIDNERMIPQQAVSSLTNVDDIEGYIRQRESETGLTFLQAIDLRLNERRRVMEELSSMGITAGSLFPGLDGACEELRERFFDF